MFLQGLDLGLLGLFSASVDDLDVVVEYGGNDGNHVCLDHSSPDVLRAADANVDHALKGQIPLPHIHHVLASAGLEQADQALDAAIDREDISDACRRGGEVGQMVQGVDQGQGRCAIQGSAVVEGRGDAHRGLVDIGDAEVDFSHDGRAAEGWATRRLLGSTGKAGKQPILR